MNKKSYLLSQIFVWIILWAICGGFAFSFYLGLLKYPDDKIALYGILIMLGMGVAFSWLWFVACRAFWRNQQNFDQSRPESELDLPHDCLEPSLPLSIQGKWLKINRGFRIESLPIGQICWIHWHSFPHRRRPGILVHFYPLGGKPVRAMFTAGNIQGALAVIDSLQKIQPQIWLSKGFYSAEFRECKRRYRNRSVIVSKGR